MRNIYIATRVNGHDSPCRIDTFGGRLDLWEAVSDECDRRNMRSPSKSANIDTLLGDYHPHGVVQAHTCYRVDLDDARRIARRLGVDL